jgi:elongation factor P hydroxylase
MVGFGHGFYGASIDELPANWTIATKRRRPEILSDPSKLLEADNAPSR